MVKRVNISFPEKTLEDLKKLIPPRERSRLVTEAIEEKLAFLKRKKAMEELENHLKKIPEEERPFSFLKTRKEIVSWVRDLREESEKRHKRLIKLFKEK